MRGLERMSPHSIDPRTPVLVGVAQLKQKPDNPLDALEPLALMTEVVAAAAADAGAPALTNRLDSIRVVKGAWPYKDPARLIAERLGAKPRQTATTHDGGNTPQSLVNLSCLDIVAGRYDAIAIVGAEAIWSRRRAHRAKQVIPYTTDDGPSAIALLHDLEMSSEVEVARGFAAPVNIYPLFESAFRASRGESIPDHIARISKLWEGFNEVAVANPYAWSRQAMTATQIATATEDNRLVGFPYTKAMNSNWDLDQAAALILCSAESASALGVPKDRWVFVWAGTDAHDTGQIAHRHSFHESPAIRLAGRRLWDLAAIGPDAVAHCDLYSCFPSAVQISATELGLGLDRQLTQTGGLTFAGGPLNNYVTHAIAAMAGTLREHAGDVGLCTANGGYLTKHALGLYSTTPPPVLFRHADVQAEVDREPTRVFDADYQGVATIESYTVMHGHEGPENALLTALTPGGQRALASSTDVDMMQALMKAEHVGRVTNIGPDARASI